MTSVVAIQGASANISVEFVGPRVQNELTDNLAVDLQNDLAVDLTVDLAVAIPLRWVGVSAATLLAISGEPL